MRYDQILQLFLRKFTTAGQCVMQIFLQYFFIHGLKYSLFDICRQIFGIFQNIRYTAPMLCGEFFCIRQHKADQILTFRRGRHIFYCITEYIHAVASIMRRIFPQIGSGKQQIFDNIHPFPVLGRTHLPVSVRVVS